jgi:hypothetical protein
MRGVVMMAGSKADAHLAGEGKREEKEERSKDPPDNWQMYLVVVVGRGNSNGGVRWSKSCLTTLLPYVLLPRLYLRLWYYLHSGNIHPY